jgi:hypothetical protein
MTSTGDTLPSERFKTTVACVPAGVFKWPSLKGLRDEKRRED